MPQFPRNLGFQVMVFYDFFKKKTVIFNLTVRHLLVNISRKKSEKFRNINV